MDATRITNDIEKLIDLKIKQKTELPDWDNPEVNRGAINQDAEDLKIQIKETIHNIAAAFRTLPHRQD